jgi:hypothetical protein
VLAAIAWINLSMALPQERLVLIPAAAFLFGFGREAFWIGYLIYPMARAFGMVLTVLPTIAAYLWLVWRALNRRAFRPRAQRPVPPSRIPYRSDLPGKPSG